MGTGKSCLSSHKDDKVSLIQERYTEAYEKITDLPSPPVEPVNEDSKNVNVETKDDKEKKSCVLVNNCDVEGCLADLSLKMNDRTVKFELASYANCFAYIGPAVIFATAATEEDVKKNYDIALRFYERAIENFNHALKHEYKLEKVKESIQQKSFQYAKRAEDIRSYLKEKLAGSVDIQDIDADSAKLVNQIKDSLVTDRPNINWSDVAGLERAKEILNEALILPVKFPHLISHDRKPWRGILLFGLQGTGKTLLAEAAVSEATSHTVFSIKPSHLIAKWMGESEKLVKYLFNMAKNQKYSIIFMDKIDSFCASATTDSKSDVIKRMNTEFSLQMQGMNSDNDGIIVLGATSKPWELDDTVCKWFEKKIYIPLPDEEARLAIIKKKIDNISSNLLDADLKLLAQRTDGYSGEDIAILIKDATMQQLRKVQTAAHFRKIKFASRDDPYVIVDDFLTPCLPGEAGATAMSWSDVPGDKLLEPNLTMDDLWHCLANTKPSTREEDVALLRKFMEDNSYE